MRKGVLRLDKLLNGKILSRKGAQFERVLVERNGATAADSRRVASEAVLAAQRKYAAYRRKK